TISASAASATSPTAATVSLPSTPVGAQARWLFAAVEHPPIPAAAINAHFDKAFLSQVPAAPLNADLSGVKTLRLVGITLSTAESLVMTVSANGQASLRVSMNVDSAGLISGLLLQQAGAPAKMPPVPTTWAGVESQVRSVAPQVQMLVAKV